MQGGGGAGPGTANAEEAEVDLMILTISEGPATAPPTLPTTSVTRPCYLADLRSATVTGSGTLNLNGGGRVVTWNGNGQSMTYENVHANGGTMLTWPSMTTLDAGAVYEIQTNGANGHPLHIHVNPYQIISMGEDSYADGYFQVGDWHDTLMIQEMAGNLGFRFHTDRFTGKVVIHCHILAHEDQGMMGILSIGGNEGAVFAEAESLDPTCYRGAFSGSSSNASDSSSDDASSASSLASSSSGILLHGKGEWAHNILLLFCSYLAVREVTAL